MGTRLLSFYRRARGGLTQPPEIVPYPTYDSDPAPLERWDCDVLEEDGMHRFKAIVAKIKHDYARL